METLQSLDNQFFLRKRDRFLRLLAASQRFPTGLIYGCKDEVVRPNWRDLINSGRINSGCFWPTSYGHHDVPWSSRITVLASLRLASTVLQGISLEFTFAS